MTPSEYLAGLCAKAGGQPPSPEQVALAQAFALAHIADSLRYLVNGGMSGYPYTAMHPE